MGVNQNFLQLEATIRKNAQEDAKSGADQTEKPTGPGGDGKDALAGAGDPTMMAASVDALIAGFKSRSPPRRRPADKGIGLHHVVGTRSAMMTSLLPSPCEQKSVLLTRQKNKVIAGSQVEALPFHSQANELPHEPSVEELQEEDTMMQDALFKHTWAF